LQRVLYLVLVGTVIAWGVGGALAWLVSGDGWGIDHFTQSKEWMTDLLGLATTIAGFLGISASITGIGTFGESGSTSEGGVNTLSGAGVGVLPLEGGMVGLLGGATLLETGGWAVPTALAVVAAGSAGVRIVRIYKGAQELPEPESRARRRDS